MTWDDDSGSAERRRHTDTGVWLRETGDTWRNVRHEPYRMHLVTMETDAGRVTQRTATTPGQHRVLGALGIAEPGRYLDFELPQPVE